jgi:ADP-heptose:LPS heptosyltransferase
LNNSNFFSKSNLKDVRDNTHKFIFDLNQRKFDVSVNLTFNKSSSYLNSLINCKLRLGLYRNTLSEISVNDNWSKYVYSNVLGSNNNPFCLVDLYRYILGGQDVLTLDEDPTVIRKKQIILHPFASSKKKRWGINKWNELIFKLAKDNPEHSLHIVGGPEDAAEAQRISNSPALKNLNGRLYIHAGTMDISGTYQILMESDLFVGHDSLVSHIAAETMTPTIVLSLGTVRPHETTAYQANVINISPRIKCFPCQIETHCQTLPCHNSISHQAVATIAHGLLNNEVIDSKFLKAKINTFQLDTVRIFSSKYQETGLVLTEISENYLSMEDVFKNFFTVIWQCYLRDTDINVALPDISENTARELYKYQDGVNYLYEIYSFGVTFSNKIIQEAEKTTPNLQAIQENITKLSELDQLCDITKKSYPMLSGFIDYFYVHKANTPGNNILEISKNNLLTYYDASNLTAVLYEFVEKSVSPYVNTAPTNMEV